MSSPEAQSGSSSSEDEFDLGGSSLKSEGNAVDKKKTEEDNSKLFSSDSEEEEDKKEDDKEDVKKESPSEKDKEMEDLFGSDYDSEEEEFKASGVKESPARDTNRSNEDLFGDETGDRSAAGGDDGGYLDKMWLPKTPKASKTAKYFISKMPNILRLVQDPYTKESIKAEMENPSDETLYRNYVRWRYKRDSATGRVLLDEVTKRPLRESNAKLVQWEDGTFSMFVGKEALTLSRQKLANSFLFVNETASDNPNFQDSEDTVPGQESVLECHARLKEKFTIRPMTTASKSHKSLTMSMRAKHNKSVQKLKEYISELDGEREQEQRVKITDEKLRLQNRKKARQGYEYDRHRASRMDAQFLEEGYDVDYDDDEHVGAIKEQFGKRKSSAAHRKQGVRRPLPGGGFDEYRSQREREADKSDSDNDAGLDEGEDDEEEEEMVIRSNKKRRTVDEEDSE
ncbi:Paf1 complex component [Phytophthora boehmeriae]|uniref:Paf1 complex component n=1 Tax=Phytophthora boehmeriae TaxID=109152 RepID=A0A8T1X1C1_9STRA|nr:Paf1 complex component [Phytophthora boehmeriae]